MSSEVKRVAFEDLFPIATGLLVYQAGPIKGCSYKGATDGREYAAAELRKRGIEALSPMRGKEFLKRKRKIGDSYPDHPMSTDGAIVSRDRSDLRRCDVVLMDLRGADKISLGTAVELGWADAWRKPVVMVIDKGNVHDHPFTRHLRAAVTDDLDEGIEMVCSILNVEYEVNSAE